MGDRVPRRTFGLRGHGVVVRLAESDKRVLTIGAWTRAGARRSLASALTIVQREVPGVLALSLPPRGSEGPSEDWSDRVVLVQRIERGVVVEEMWEGIAGPGPGEADSPGVPEPRRPPPAAGGAAVAVRPPGG